jgi:predicted transposase/invertase (TIGR01784 family)
MSIIQFSEAEELLDLRYDHVFKAVFARNSKASRIALSDLISALIGRIVSVETITANEPPVEWAGDRRMRFDISCTAQTGELINIEMSFDPGSFVPERFEFHEAKLFIGQDIIGNNEGYSKLKEAYQITILSDDRFFPDDALIHTFQYYDPDNRVSLNGKTRIIIMELVKAGRVIEKPVSEMSEYEAWAAFFRYLTEKEKRGKINEIVKAKEGIAMASEALGTISPELREYFFRISEEKYYLDTLEKRLQAERREKETRQKEMEAMARGMAEGMAKDKLEIAKKMKNVGRPLSEIIEFTDLTSDCIEKL